MQVTTRCPHCRKEFEVPEGVLGKRTRCTSCGERFDLERYEPVPEVGMRSFGRSPELNGTSLDGEFAVRDVVPPLPVVSPIADSDRRPKGNAPTPSPMTASDIVIRCIGLMLVLASFVWCGVMIVGLGFGSRFQSDNAIGAGANAMELMLVGVSGGMTALLGFLLYFYTAARQIRRKLYQSERSNATDQ